MNEDLRRACLWAGNDHILVPSDHESLPMSIDQEGELVAWTGFESEELARQTQALDPKAYQWGQINGLQYLKFLNERIEAGGQHVLVMNPGTSRQSAMDQQAIITFLTWLDDHPQGLDHF